MGIKYAVSRKPAVPSGGPAAYSISNSPELRKFSTEIRSVVRELRACYNPMDIARAVADAINAEAGRRPERALDRAAARGLVVREEAKHEEGGNVSADEAARMLGISKTSILERYKKGRVLGWREARQNAVRFPYWQFSVDGMLKGLPEVLAILGHSPHIDDWGKIMFFLNPRQSLHGERPLDALRHGRQAVVEGLAWGDVE